MPIEDCRERGSERPGLLGGFTLSCYLRLLDWTSRLVRTGKARVSAEAASLFERLQVTAEEFQVTIQQLFSQQKLVGAFFGRQSNLQRAASHHGRRWVRNRGTRKLCPAH